MELRIYQNDQIETCKPEPAEIEDIINKIVHFDKILKKEKMKEES